MTSRMTARSAGWLRRVGVALACMPVAFAPLACGPAAHEDNVEPYLPRNAHQAYGYSLAQTRLTQTALGRDWLSAAETALAAPEALEMPISRQSTFTASEPSALGYRFAAAVGDRIDVRVTVDADEPLEVFVDLFRIGDQGLAHLASAPPAAPRSKATLAIEWDVLEDAAFLLRVQPELLRSGQLDVAVSRSPLLAFPVTGLGLGAIQSGFGAERDGGRRAHRGADIFAPRGTETVAALDGWVARVDATPRGGIWLQPLFGNMRLYYAHLDAQLVSEGDFVRAGDVIGRVGNTGNARTTPPHLHFGVYLRRRGMRGGARDPYGFLD
jgi:murein DD-endopeptidase MepM/ murein hydrolase activator NlpD